MQNIKNIEKKHVLTVVVIIIFILLSLKFLTVSNKIFKELKPSKENLNNESEIKNNNENFYNIIEYYLIPDDKITGIWNYADYIENIEDFNITSPDYKNHRKDLYSVEFFEDKTAVLNCFQKKVNCDWTKKYVENKDIFFNSNNLMSVYLIKNIAGNDYMFAEYINDSNETPGYYVFKRGRIKELYEYSNANNKDLRNYNLSTLGKNIICIDFNGKTKFPTDNAKLPQIFEYQPYNILEHGKNPGLGIKALHEQGITGKGVNVAIIDEALYLDHPEYAGKIKEYIDFDGESKSSMQGPAVASLLAGKNIGTAPDVNIYYAAVPGWKAFDAKYYADALDWVVERNKTLPENEKIKIACISPNPKDMLPWINVVDYLKSFQRAEEAGILLLDCTNEHGVIFGACKYNYENPEDVTLCKPVNPYRIMIASYHYDTVQEIFIEEEDESAMLRIPVNYRTLAEEYEEGEFSYQYMGIGDLSWTIPYATGVLAMGWQVKPELKPDEIVKILFDTAYVDNNGRQYINPTAFIEYLRNN